MSRPRVECRDHLRAFAVPPVLIGPEPVYASERDRENALLVQCEAAGFDPWEIDSPPIERAVLRRSLWSMGLPEEADRV